MRTKPQPTICHELRRNYPQCIIARLTNAIVEILNNTMISDEVAIIATAPLQLELELIELAQNN